MSSYIVVDIGGTHLRAALYPSEGLNPDQLTRITTKDEKATALERLIELIAEVWPVDKPVKGICVAVPGPTDPHLGIVIEAPNIPGWEELPLQKILEERFAAPVVLGNDANLAALAEWRYGAGQGHHNLLYLTISTGIGSGVIIKDQLLVGAHGLAAELGHTTIQAEGGPLCGCGQYGHLESLASGTAMLRWVEEQLAAGRVSRLAGQPGLNGKMISQAAGIGDELAIAALARSGTYIGIGLANFLHIFNPTIVILGGGVSQSRKFLIDPLRAALEKHVFAPEYLNDLKIEIASFGDEAGLIGALALARELFPPEHGL